MNKSGTAPLPARLAGLVREAKWLLLGALALYLLLVFVTYHRGDPGWSHTGTDSVTRNAGGALGAWLADIFLYLFGLSAFWLVALCALAVLWGYRRLDARSVGFAAPSRNGSPPAGQCRCEGATRRSAAAPRSVR